jgi:UDP-2,3-diacylglucosamine hydrolase
VCQWLYAAIHPRWTYPIATGWSNENRTRRDPHQQQAISELAASHLLDFSRDYYRQHPDVDAFVYGHIHLARVIDGNDTLPPVIFLGEWISLNSYVVLDRSGAFSLKFFEK